MTRFTALRAVRELSRCSEHEVSSLLRYTDEVDASAGAVIAEQGHLAAAFVVVMEGTLRAGSCLLKPGDSFGWDAMWERTANPATLVADSDARLLVMSHDQFRAVKGLARAAIRRPSELRVLAPA